MSLSVERLIADSKHSQMRCVAGFEGLSNPITCFTIVDTPDIARWVRSGAFVASVGYVTSENPRLKTTLIRDLAKKGCACLAVKVNHYYAEAREEFIEQGNEYGFPIIEVDYSLRFSDIANQIHQTIFQDRMELTEKSHLLYNQLIQILLSDTDIEEVLYRISTALSNPVMLLDKELHLIEFENTAENPIDLSSFLNLKKKEPIMGFKEIKKILNLYEKTHFRFHSQKLSQDNMDIHLTFAPIILNDTPWGFLAIPETDLLLTSEHLQVLENIKTAIGMYFLKTKYMPDKQVTEKNDFVHQVLLNEKISKRQLQTYANIYGFNSRNRRICMDIRVENYDTFPFEKRHSISDMIRVSVVRYASQLSLETFYIHYENHFPIYIFFPPAASIAAIRNDSMILAQNLLTWMKEQEIPVKIGISMLSDDISQIPNAFRQSVNMLTLGNMIQPESFIYTYDDLQIYHMLDSTLSLDELKSFADLIWPLYLEDRDNGTNFIETLDTFIRCRFNATQTAAELFLHRNSLSYRLNRIWDILGISTEQQQDYFQFQLSICALKLYLGHQNLSLPSSTPPTAPH